MKWEEAVDLFRKFRRKGIPIQLGVNALLLSPLIPSQDDTGWRLRIFQKLFSTHKDQIRSISGKVGLDSRFVESKAKKYLEIFSVGYCDPIHLKKESRLTIEPVLIQTSKIVP